VVMLRRLQSGPFSEAQAVNMEALEKAAEAGSPELLDNYLHPTDLAVENLEKVNLPSGTADFIRHGQAIIARGLPVSGEVRLYDDGDFFGIGKILDDGRVAPVRLMNFKD